MASTGDIVSAFATGALPSLISHVDVYSAFSPPTTIDVAEALAPRPAGAQPTLKERFARLVQPTVVLRGPAVKTQVLAPYGSPSPDAWKLNLALLAIAAGGIAALFTMSIYKVGVFRGRRG